METNTTFFVALLGKVNFESQTVLTTDHLLSQSHRLLCIVISQIIYIMDQSIYRYETHRYRQAKKDCSPIYVCLEALNQRCRDSAHPAPNLRTCSSNESSGRSVYYAANYQLHLRNKINKCICINYASSRY